jgi:ribosomal protein S18 acetylase RimI-like enzyme
LSFAGFVHRGNLGISGREAFRIPEGFGPKAHIYAGKSEIVAFRNHLAVRDALRASQALRDEYGQIKSDIAAAVGNDIEEYVSRKTDFLATILSQSGRFSASELLGIQVANRCGTLIRPLAAGDEIGTANVHTHSWRETYSGLIAEAYLDSLPTKFAERLDRWRKIILESAALIDRKTLVAERDGNILGFVSVGANRDVEFEGSGELWSLYLLKACQRKQIGYLLLCEGLKFLRERGYRSAYAWVLAGNPTLSFYRRTGAVDTGQRKTVEFGGRPYEEIAVRWNSLDHFV